MRKALEDLGKHYGKFKDVALSEIDTQVLYVETVLEIAGYDVRNPKLVKRANRANNKAQFDVEVYPSENDYRKRIGLAIECKSITSDEFNIKNFEIGEEVGPLTNAIENGPACWKNKHKDGLGQLRAYCLNAEHFAKGDSLAVFTNGFEWVAIEDPSFSCPEDASSPISSETSMMRATLDDSESMLCFVHRLHKWCSVSAPGDTEARP